MALYYRYYRRAIRRRIARLGWGTLHWWLLFISGIWLAKIAAVAFFWLGGIGIWLESLPPSAWILAIALSVGFAYLSLTPMILWERKRLRALVMQASCDRTQIEWIVAKALHQPRQLPTTDPSRMLPEYSDLVDAVMLLTQHPTPGGVCVHCGAHHPALATEQGRYDPNLHGDKLWADGTTTPCPVPKARALAMKAQIRITAASN